MTINPRQLSAATPPAAVPETAASRPPVGQLDPVGPRQGRSGDTTGRRRGGNPLGNPGLNLAPRCGARARLVGLARAVHRRWPTAGAGCMAGGSTRASDAGGESEAGPRRTPRARAPAAAPQPEGAAGCPDVWSGGCGCSSRLVRLQQEHAGGDGGAVGAVSAGVPAARRSRRMWWLVPNAPRTPCTCLPPLRRASRARTDKGTGGVVGLALNGRAAERAAAVTEVALQAPWREAIAFARAVKRAVLAEKRDAHAARRAASAARRVVRAVTTTGRRGESGETGAVRLNPTQLSARVAPAAARDPVAAATRHPSRSSVRSLDLCARQSPSRTPSRPEQTMSDGAATREGRRSEPALLHPARDALLGSVRRAPVRGLSARDWLVVLLGPAPPLAGWRIPQFSPLGGGPGEVTRFYDRV